MSGALILFSLACSKDSPVEPIRPAQKVEITSPLPNAPVFGNVNIQVTVVSEKAVRQVELLVDNQLDSTRVLYSAPFTFTWSIPEEPDSTVHSLQSRAIFADGSNLVSVSIRAVSYRLAPSNLQLSSLNEAAIGLTWHDNSKFETGFFIERSVRDSSFVVVDSVSSNIVSRTMPGPFLTNTDYSFRIRANSSQGFSRYSNVALAHISFPAPFISRIQSQNDSTIELTWSHASQISRSFNIERSTDGMLFDSLSSIPAGSDSIHTATLYSYYLLAQPYYFRIRVRSSCNYSPYSNIVNSTVAFLPPSGLRLSSATQTQITLEWAVVSRFTQRVRLEKQIGSQGFHELALLEVGTRTFTDPDLDTSQTYQYRVQALNGGTVSEYSPSLTVRYTSYGGFTLLRTMQGHSQDVWNVGFTSNDQVITSSSNDHTVRLWDAATGITITTLSVAPSGLALAPPLSTTDEYVAVAEVPSSIRIHDGHSGALITTLPNAPAIAIAFSPDGQYLANCIDGYFTLWRTIDWVELYERQDYAMYSIAISPDNTYLVTGGEQRYANIYETSNGSRVRWVEGSNYSPVRAVCFSPDSREVAVAGDEGLVYAYRVSDGARLFCSTYQNRVFGIVYSPDGNAILAGGMNNKVYVWSQGALVTTISEPGYVCGLAYSRDGRYLVTGNYDHSVRLYRAGGWAGSNSTKRK